MSEDSTPGRESQRLRTSRMEAFSDGVFAIAITLLVLELVVPSLEGGSVGQRLLEEWPSYLAYLVSFASIGAAWVEHSAITEHLDRADPVLLRLNLLLLFFVSLLPFATRMIGEYAEAIDAERIAVTVYGINLLAISAMTSVVWRHAVAEGLTEADLPEEDVRAIAAKLNPSLGLYGLAIGIGLLAPRAAIFLYLAIALYLLVPSGRSCGTCAGGPRSSPYLDDEVWWSGPRPGQRRRCWLAPTRLECPGWAVNVEPIREVGAGGVLCLTG